MRRSRLLLLVLLLVTAIAVGGCGAPKNVAPQEWQPPVPLRTLTDADRDVTFQTVDGFELRIDIYRPAKTDGKPAPVVVYLHGGGWMYGDKTGGPGIEVIPELVKRGYVVASPNYRLAPAYKFPAQIEDVKCAIRFLRANAAKYGLDPERIGVLGNSAGGHLAALLALTDVSDGFEGSGGYADQSSRVQAVADWFGVVNLLDPKYRDPALAKVFAQPTMTMTEREVVYRRFSPVTYVSKDAPPFLILHGEKDTLVPFQQSADFAQQLQAAGAPVTFMAVKNAGHSFVPAGGTVTPTREEIITITADFFDRVLK